MRVAMRAAARIRHSTSPNPWVGAVVVRADGDCFVGATEPAGGRHGEVVALDAAGDATGATLYTTLEPCVHEGRTRACTEAIIESGVARVVVAITDPDSRVAGAGIARLTQAGIAVTMGVCAGEAAAQLAPYLHHRMTARPWVTAKVAASLDGRTAAPDGSSQWLTGPEARCDAHRLRACSDAVIVGARTVRFDDPSLTVRDWVPPAGTPAARDPQRIVLGSAATDARVHPCIEWTGDPGVLLDRLGASDFVGVLVEGGATVLGDLARADLINEYVIYLAPALLLGDNGRPMFAGTGVPTMSAVTRWDIVDVARLGPDVRVTLRPPTSPSAPGVGARSDG